jgi:hypothetical protein
MSVSDREADENSLFTGEIPSVADILHLPGWTVLSIQEEGRLYQVSKENEFFCSVIHHKLV